MRAFTLELVAELNFGGELRDCQAYRCGEAEEELVGK